MIRISGHKVYRNMYLLGTLDQIALMECDFKSLETSEIEDFLVF
jgi:hypothetical protein